MDPQVLGIDRGGSLEQSQELVQARDFHHLEAGYQSLEPVRHQEREPVQGQGWAWVSAGAQVQVQEQERVPE